MSDNRTLSITIVATSEKAQAELRRLGDEAQTLGLKTGAASETVKKHGEHVETMGHKTHQAFNAVQSAATSVGASMGPVGEVLERFTSSLTNITSGTSRVRNGLQRMGAAATAVGGIIAIEGARDQAAIAQLKVAVDNAGKSWDDYEHHLHKAAEAQAVNGHSAKDAYDALTKLTAAFNDPEKAIEELGLAADQAARQHISLSDAAGQVASVVGGNMKTLRQYGINIKDLVDPVKELAAAEHALSAAHAQVAQATQRLSDFEANLAEQRTNGQEAHAQRVEAAKSKVADADQHLTDVIQRNSEQQASAQTQADERVKSTSDRLADARQNLADVELRVHEATKLTLSDQFAMRDAQQALTDVQQKIADGQLAGADAAMALRDAQQHVADQAAQNAEKQKVSTSDANALRDAHAGVAKAANDHTSALGDQKTAGQSTTAQQNAHRDALAQVADAHAALAKAQASDAGAETLKQTQQERELREGLAAAILKQKDATEAVATGKEHEAEFTDKVTAALETWQAKVKGSAAAQAKTVDGMFKHWVASAQNAFAKLGPSVGLGLIAASAALDIFLALSHARWISYAASTIALNIRVAAAIVASYVSAAAPMLLAMAPWIAAVAAVGIAAYFLYKHWDQIWGWIKGIVKDGVEFIKHHFDWIIAVVFGPFGIAINLIRKNWDSIWGAIKSTASGVADFFSTVFGGIAMVVMSPIQLMISGINWIIDKINSVQIHYKAPWILGGWRIDFDGFGIPHIPDLPGFADGGIVPGQVGKPVLAMVHGGEKIENPAQQRARWGGGASGTAGQVVVDLRGAVFVTDKAGAHKLGLQVADGVLDGLRKKQNAGTNLQLTGRKQ